MIKSLSNNMYQVQQLPFGQDLDQQPGVPYKEMVARMEKLPSQLVVHHHPMGADSNWVTFRCTHAQAPLSHTLGITEFGKYRQTNRTSKHAYEPIAQLWHDLAAEDAGTSDGKGKTREGNDT